jgi:ribosomal protein S18 acetylase RimI-like enzyme
VAIVVRSAKPGDEAALARIERETWAAYGPPEEYEARPFFAGTKLEEVLVAELDGAVVGYVSLRPPSTRPSNDHVLAITGIAVAPDAQRRGIGGRLLEAAESYASDREVERLTLRVLASNTRARALYERLGYETEGTLRGEFRMPLGPDGALVAVDDVLMAKTITPAHREQEVDGRFRGPSVTFRG